MEVTIVGTKNNQTFAATRIHPEGLLEANLPPAALGTPAAETVPPTAYRLRIRFADGSEFETFDPYAFPPVLTDYDLYLSGEGTHYLKYEKLGAHVREIAGVQRRAFRACGRPTRSASAWSAISISWDGRVHPMRSRGASGIWELFMPGLDEGALYKFEIRLPRRESISD